MSTRDCSGDIMQEDHGVSHGRGAETYRGRQGAGRRDEVGYDEKKFKKKLNSLGGNVKRELRSRKRRPVDRGQRTEESESGQI